MSNRSTRRSVNGISYSGTRSLGATPLRVFAPRSYCRTKGPSRISLPWKTGLTRPIGTRSRWATGTDSRMRTLPSALGSTSSAMGSVSPACDSVPAQTPAISATVTGGSMESKAAGAAASNSAYARHPTIFLDLRMTGESAHADPTTVSMRYGESAGGVPGAAHPCHSEGLRLNGSRGIRSLRAGAGGPPSLPIRARLRLWTRPGWSSSG